MALSFQTDVPQFDVSSISPASEMKTLANSKEYVLTAERAAVESVIKTSAMAGNTSAIYQSPISDTVMAELKAAGYTVDFFPDSKTVEEMKKAGYYIEKNNKGIIQYIIRWE